MLKLYYAPNTISVAAAIALEEAEVAYDAIKVSLADADQTKPAYLAINPKGRVPALVIDDGVLTETGAILEYATPTLIPKDPLAAARVRELMFYLASTMHVAHAHRMRGNRWVDQQSSLDDMKAKVSETMAACARHLEDTLAFAAFAMGENVTAADAYLFTVLNWLGGDGVDIANTPKLAAYFEMMGARPSIQAAQAKGML